MIETSSDELGINEVLDEPSPVEDWPEWGMNETNPDGISFRDMIMSSDTTRKGRRLLVAKYNKLSNRCRATTLELKKHGDGKQPISPGLQKLKVLAVTMHSLQQSVLGVYLDSIAFVYSRTGMSYCLWGWAMSLLESRVASCCNGTGRI